MRYLTLLFVAGCSAAPIDSKSVAWVEVDGAEYIHEGAFLIQSEPSSDAVTFEAAQQACAALKARPTTFAEWVRISNYVTEAKKAMPVDAPTSPEWGSPDPFGVPSSVTRTIHDGFQLQPMAPGSLALYRCSVPL